MLSIRVSPTVSRINSAAGQARFPGITVEPTATATVHEAQRQASAGATPQIRLLISALDHFQLHQGRHQSLTGFHIGLLGLVAVRGAAR